MSDQKPGHLRTIAEVFDDVPEAEGAVETALEKVIDTLEELADNGQLELNQIVEGTGNLVLRSMRIVELYNPMTGETTYNSMLKQFDADGSESIPDLAGGLGLIGMLKLIFLAEHRHRKVQADGTPEPGEFSLL